jgi:hypothetical protein
MNCIYFITAAVLMMLIAIVAKVVAMNCIYFITAAVLMTLMIIGVNYVFRRRKFIGRCLSILVIVGCLVSALTLLAKYLIIADSTSEAEVLKLKDGRQVIEIEYELANASEGKYHIRGELKIHDNMTGKNLTVASQTDVFVIDDDGTYFSLYYTVPKELASEKDISDAEYTVNYASGYSQTRTRYEFSYAESATMCGFEKDSRLKISKVGKPEDKIISKVPGSTEDDE